MGCFLASCEWKVMFQGGNLNTKWRRSWNPLIWLCIDSPHSFLWINILKVPFPNLYSRAYLKITGPSNPLEMIRWTTFGSWSPLIWVDPSFRCMNIEFTNQLELLEKMNAVFWLFVYFVKTYSCLIWSTISFFHLFHSIYNEFSIYF